MLQRTGGFHRYEDPGRFPIDQAPESVGFIAGTVLAVMFYIYNILQHCDLLTSWMFLAERVRNAESDRFIAGTVAVAEEEKRRRDRDAAKKAQEVLRRREEVLHVPVGFPLSVVEVATIVCCVAGRGP